MTTRHSVVPRTMCFVFYKNKVLLMKASKKKDWEGMYDPLGGHIEKGEGIITSAKREIKEESGLKAVNTKLCGIVHVADFFGKDVMMFVTSSQAKTNKIKTASDEGIAEWININDLDKIKVFEDVKPILKQVLKLEKGKIFIGLSRFDGQDKLVSLEIKLN